MHKNFLFNQISPLFDGCSALSLDDQIRDVWCQCQDNDIATFAKMICYKHTGHDDVLKLKGKDAVAFLEEIDPFLTSKMVEKQMRQ